jgi:hypothetical protein
VRENEFILPKGDLQMLETSGMTQKAGWQRLQVLLAEDLKPLDMGGGPQQRLRQSIEPIRLQGAKECVK